MRSVLPAVGRGDEGAVAHGPGEDDVHRLVPHQQGARDPREGNVQRIDLHEAHAVGQMIDNPHLGAARGVDASGQGHGLEAHRDFAHEGQTFGHDVVDREAVVRRVDGEEPAPIWRERERPHLTALEVHERRLSRRGTCKE